MNAAPSLFELIGLLIALSALFGFLNTRFLRLPDVIGITAVGLLFSVLLLLAGGAVPELTATAAALIEHIDFPEVVFHGMLSALLFAGSLHVNLANLRAERLPIIALATVGVLASTFLVGGIAYGLSSLAGVGLSPIHCLLFGALISPTDPIAVLGILKLVGASKKLESRITGESLFNDGTGVVVFMVLLGLATGEGEASAGGILGMFALEAGGGILFGLAIGALALAMLRRIDSYAVEIMLTLAIVTAGYSLAESLHLSAPLYVVAAGLVIGNLGPGKALSERTQAHLFPFWQLVDEILNLLLFGLIGLELLALAFQPVHLIAGIVMVPMVLLARWISVGVPMRTMQRMLPERDQAHTISVMTWGGLRGGISIALALSLPTGAEKELIVWATYVVVLFSILVQATTLAPLMRRLGLSNPANATADGHP
ncbi:MAG: sodium:proton antiporter [Rhodocyclaceae bacterium]|nr:sodium:proton antiporter [Rhodocyclaceae bacterium]